MAYNNGYGMYGNGHGGMNAPNGYNQHSPSRAGRDPTAHLPYHMRQPGAFQEPMRPQSSMSTASFASQVGGAPLPADYYGANNGMHNGGMQTPQPNYGYNNQQYPVQPAGGDPFTDNGHVGPRAPNMSMYNKPYQIPAMPPVMPNTSNLQAPTFDIKSHASRPQAPHPPQQNGYSQQPSGFAPQQNGYAPQQNGYAPQQSFGQGNGQLFRHMRSDSAQGGPGHSLAQLIRSGNVTDNQAVDQFEDTPAYVGDRRLSHALQPSTPQRNGRGQNNGPNARYRGNSFQNWTAQQPPAHMAPSMVGRPFMVQTAPPPAWFNQVSQGYKPDLQEALASLPLTNQLRELQPCTMGVLKFLNIPYATSKNELLAVLGRNAQINQMPAGTPYFAVHIIMDRNSGKTMDAFVEVSSPREALNIASQLNRRAQVGRTIKLGDRHVDVEISSQEELMRELFPRAKNVEWVGNSPRVIDEDTEYFSSVQALGFDGFVGSEEMVMLVKFAEQPSRSPFTNRSPNRIYECMISSLHKYPWHAPEAVLLSDRKKVFDTTLACIKALMHALRRPSEHLSVSLLQELTVAALFCPGFSEQQKAQIVAVMYTAGYGAQTVGHGMAVHLGGRHHLSPAWPFLALSKKPQACDPLLDFYATLISEATADPSNMSLGQMAAAYSTAQNNDPFGNLEINYGTSNMSRMSLADVAQKEFDGIADVLGGMLLNISRLEYHTPPTIDGGVSEYE